MSSRRIWRFMLTKRWIDTRMNKKVKKMKVAGFDADWYVMDNGTAAMVIEKTAGGYVELFFRYQDTEGEQMIDEQTVFNILDKLKIEK